nr:septum site-determining protein MinC [uncultured Rhizobium sp.]
MTKVLTDARSIRIKGRSFLAVVLSPDLPLDNWLSRLDDLAARSAGFFLDRPVVLDISEVSIDKIELKDLLEQLAERNVRIMGIEGARPSMLGPGMPPAMRGGKAASDFEVPEKSEDKSAQESSGQVGVATKHGAKQPETDTDSQLRNEPIKVAEVRPVIQSLVINEPVRSGQSVIFAEGDVTVIGSVASGAEVIAGGSVHVYGAIRGRVMAGSLGNATARIFCRKLEAELVAIDGIYKMAEDMDASLRGQPVQLWLDGDIIMAETLS